MSPAELTAAWRTIDANFNRAVEGLRVVEDHARFVLNDAFLAEQSKTLRHDLTTALTRLDPTGTRLAARDTLADVGTAITSAQETKRDTPHNLAAANWQRASQAIRVIEEFAKLVGGDGGAFEKLRYRSYTLAKAFALNGRSEQIWAGRQLYVLIDGQETPEQFAAMVSELIAAGVQVLQLRDKRLDDRRLLARGHQLRQLIDEHPSEHSKPLFIMNDRPDLAILARADGVHVGQEELPVSEVRRLVGTEMQIGVSTHSIEQARAAVLDGADYIGCGPTFPSNTKPFSEFPGLEFLRQVAAEINLPAFAIGGIHSGNLPQVLATGFTRVAVSSAVTAAHNRTQAVTALREQLAARPGSLQVEV
jgi:thiamine-phosphate pyrophosphorylase